MDLKASQSGQGTFTMSRRTHWKRFKGIPTGKGAACFQKTKLGKKREERVAMMQGGFKTLSPSLALEGEHC